MGYVSQTEPFFVALISVLALQIACVRKGPKESSHYEKAPMELSGSDMINEFNRWDKQLDQAISHGATFRKCAVFDADGTLWKGDFTEALGEETIRRQDAKAAALPPLNQLLLRFGIPPESTPTAAMVRLIDAYNSGELTAAGHARNYTPDEINRLVWPSYNLLFAGWTLPDLEQRIATLLAGGFAGQLYPDMVRIIFQLRSLQYSIRVVSAGIEPAVKQAVNLAGIYPEEVRGMRNVVESDMLTSEIEPPIMYGAGKLSVLLEECGGPPAFVFADSVATSDRLMIESAWKSIAVNPGLAGEKHVEYAKTHGLLILSLETSHQRQFPVESNVSE